MKIAVYIDNQNISQVNLSDLRCGNPGIGGTEYSILLFAQSYKEAYTQNQVYLYASTEGIFPQLDRVRICSMMEMLDELVVEQVDILLISARNRGIELSDEFFYEISRRGIKTITWGHNFYFDAFCDKLVECDAVRANVFVGRQQYDRYIDHKIIEKSTYIYNIYPVTKETRSSCEENVVTYIGSIVPAKGFDILARSWKKILKEVPDATLNVVGSGILYSRNAKLGKYGIAEETYEKKFINDLLDENGQILPSVHFWGVLGSEKVEVIKKTKVGVVNPSGRTETFGISALDFESLCVPVVTVGKGGFLDTVVHKKTGLLYRNPKKIAQYIVSLLKDNEKNMRYGVCAKEYALKFQPENIIGVWNELFIRVVNDQPIEYKAPRNFYFHNFKWARIINRKIQKKLKKGHSFSMISLESKVSALLNKTKRLAKGKHR